MCYCYFSIFDRIWQIHIVSCFGYRLSHIDAGVKNDHIIMSLYKFIFIVQQAYIHKNPFNSRRFNKTRYPKLFET